MLALTQATASSFPCRGPQYFSEHTIGASSYLYWRNGIPTPQMIAQDNCNSNCWCGQLPLVVAFAIHKSQAGTFDAAVVHTGDREQSGVLTY